jgi:hypothetical protein
MTRKPGKLMGITYGMLVIILNGVIWRFLRDLSVTIQVYYAELGATLSVIPRLIISDTFSVIFLLTFVVFPGVGTTLVLLEKVSPIVAFHSTIVFFLSELCILMVVMWAYWSPLLSVTLFLR